MNGLKLKDTAVRASLGALAWLVVFIALAVAVGATALGGGVNHLFNTVGSTLTGINVPTPPGQ